MKAFLVGVAIALVAAGGTAWLYAIFDVQAEAMRPLVPVENVRLTGRVVPFDKRLPSRSGTESKRRHALGLFRHG